VNKIFVGCTGIISSVILYGCVHLSNSIYLVNLNGWSDPPGRYMTALTKTYGIIPFIISLIIFTYSLYLIYNNYKENR